MELFWNMLIDSDELNNDDEQRADEVLSDEMEKEETGELEINPKKKSEAKKLRTFFYQPEEVDTNAK